MKTCPHCHLESSDISLFCPFCGTQFPAPEASTPLYSCTIPTESGSKELSICYGDITALPFSIDLVAISAYRYDYAPTPHTLIRALKENCGIDVAQLAETPAFDLRRNAGCWISEALPKEFSIRRIAGIEFTSYFNRETERNDSALLLSRIQSFFSLLDIASANGVSLNTVVLPLLGTGNQKISTSLLTVPLVNETIAFLRRNPSVKRLIYMNYDLARITQFAAQASASLQLTALQTQQPAVPSSGTPYVFISYSSADLDKVLLLEQLLSKHHISNWYAKRDMQSGLYSTQIVENIERCTHFICLISHHSMASYHVLNELNLAFNRLQSGMVLIPYFVEECPLEPSFQYYLSSLEWKHGTPPPLEARMEEFIHSVFKV